MNRILLNDKRIQAARAKPGQEMTAFYDSIVPGLALRVRDTGRRTFYVWYRDQATHKTKWKQVTDARLVKQEYPHLTLARARELAREMLTAAGEGRDLGQDRVAAEAAQAAAHAQTFAALGAKYISEWAQGPNFPERPRKKSWQGDQRILRGPLQPLADRPVAALTRREVRALLDAMTARGAEIYANRVLACVRKVLNFAVDKEWIDVNPIGRVAANEEHARTKVLSDAEVLKYWQWLEAPPATADAARVRLWPLLAAWCRLRLVTLARSNEVLAMQWTHLEGLDGKRPVWNIPDTKNGRPHLVPLSPLAVAILKDLRRVQGDPVWVFTGIRSARDRKQIFKGAGLADFQYRDARRTAATNLGKLQVDEFFISRVLNHSRRGNITAVYNHWQYEPEKRDALNKWASHLQRIVKPLRLVRKRGAA